MKIEFLCAESTNGCEKCSQFLKTVVAVVSNLELQADIQLEEINDIDYFLKQRVYFTPALIIDGELISRGRFLTGEQIRQRILARI